MSADGNNDFFMENMIAGLIVITICLLLFAYYEIYIWHKLKLALYYGLDFLHPTIAKGLFFYKSEFAELIPTIKKLLVETPAELFDAAKHEDFLEDYTDEDFAYYLQMKSNIDIVTGWLVYPYILIFTIIYITLFYIKQPKHLVAAGKYRLYPYVESQAHIWVYSSIFMKSMKSLASKRSLNSGIGAMSSLPLDWLKERGVLLTIKSSKKKLFTVSQRHELIMSADKAYKAASENLGKTWEGLEALSFDEKSLIFVIVTHLFGDVRRSRQLNRKLNVYHGDLCDQLDKSRKYIKADIEKDIKELEEKYSSCFVQSYFKEDEFQDPFDPLAKAYDTEDGEKDMFDTGRNMVNETLMTHSYFYTVILSLYIKSWKYGVLASGELMWLRKISRELWYPISQAGRYSAFCDVSGIWSHFQAERSYGFRCIIPDMKGAIDGYDHYMWKTHENYFPDNVWEDPSRFDELRVKPSQGSGGMGAR
ncbi:MAG: hypothetical protein HAW67_02315 [Endozoicomonadaceae bacterium]|nr:hypothetical protein [Endozoicomonadaceae bacterium]